MLVGLLTDFGDRSNFVGVMKGVILKINPYAKLVDITHKISFGSVREALFLLYKSYSYFPEGTIFVVVVDPQVGSERKALAIKTKNYYFVGPDNGVLSWAVFEDGVEKIIEVKNKKYFLKNISSTFHGRDIFAPVAAYISRGVKIEKLGKRIKRIKKLDFPQVKIKKDTLKGEILYIDSFGNLVTNIKKDAFLNFVKNKKFIAILNGKKIRKLHNFYSQAKSGIPFFIEGSFSFLEISLYLSSAKEYFKAKEEDTVIIKRL
ncbi:MAG: hypothetical protein B6D56_07285 [Candidatus Omnitrophica bacterium 4484_70.1]|nr:MAG: hypothetical protein B6D56_07285 [Candidatus Omnitrophica bacterium 4484_70.1]